MSLSGAKFFKGNGNIFAYCSHSSTNTCKAMVDQVSLLDNCIRSPALVRCVYYALGDFRAHVVETWCCQVDLGNSALTYIPGDALGILPTNCPQVPPHLFPNDTLPSSAITKPAPTPSYQCAESSCLICTYVLPVLIRGERCP